MKSKEIYNKYVIKDKKSLREVLRSESNLYKNYMYKDFKSYLLGWLKNENIVRIMHWQKIARNSDYHDYQYHTTGSIYHLICYLWYIRKRNILGNKIGLEMSTELIDAGLLIYHFNNVVNTNASIGKNCHIHGTVVIGNNGTSTACPIIGNNVMIGAGAKIIGPVTIADDIKIAAGAVVVNSFTEPGITIGGVPARKLK